MQGYVNASWRAQQWIHRAKDEEVVELLYKPYMDSFSREVVLRSVKYYRTIFDWDFLIEEKDYDNGTQGVGPAGARQADPLRQGRRHVLREEGPGQVQVLTG